MTIDLQNIVWEQLPNDFKWEVIHEWKHTDNNVTKYTLEYLFGKINLKKQ